MGVHLFSSYYYLQLREYLSFVGGEKTLTSYLAVYNSLTPYIKFKYLLIWLTFPLNWELPKCLNRIYAVEALA